jgi:hypothetical protein
MTYNPCQCDNVCMELASFEHVQRWKHVHVMRVGRNKLFSCYLGFIYFVANVFSGLLRTDNETLCMTCWSFFCSSACSIIFQEWKI